MNHFSQLIVTDENDQVDIKRTFLNFWRFGPEIKGTQLDHLWQNLPADTRVPDHTIWSHLDITSAFAGAMEADEQKEISLLSVSFGPVQSFIAEARSTSDLWAGSHLLARIAWEGMKKVCEVIGPDAILFPNLRGIPQVDLWLREIMNLPAAQFHEMDWSKKNTDNNPLFGAALPNRFVAIVPTGMVADLTKNITEHVRSFVLSLGEQSLSEILNIIGEENKDACYGYQQLSEQLAGFPEVYWAAVPWSLIAKGKDAQTDKLRAILTDFYPDSHHLGFLDSQGWQVLQQSIELDGVKFYIPNAGTLYPALYDLLDRVAAAAKSVRPFQALTQEGYRSDMNGEREWLTIDKSQLTLPPGQRTKTLWTRLAAEKPGWVKKGEHLDALNMIKRLWPKIFVEEVKKTVGCNVDRYIISTHTLALAVNFEQWLKNPGENIPRDIVEILNKYRSQAGSTALPKRIMKRLYENKKHSRFDDIETITKCLPATLDLLKSSDDKAHQDDLSIIEQCVSGRKNKLFDQRIETYYGMILLDGDKMGAWLSGTEPDYQITYRECWHEKIRCSSKITNLKNSNPALTKYLDTKRPPSPSRHRTISTALNLFSLKVASFVVEDCFKGKLVYAGGDDVFAFIAVDDLLPAMTLLRYLYSGKKIPAWIMKTEGIPEKLRSIKSENGYIWLNNELMLTMGEKAGASCGAIIAHHQAPLSYVLRELRQAESTAKNEGDRNAFCLKILKRGGGSLTYTDKWESADENPNDKQFSPDLINSLAKLFAQPEVSRRAAYHSVSWLKQLPNDAAKDMLIANLTRQFKQQGGGVTGRNLAVELVSYCVKSFPDNAPAQLAEILMTAEFLARESRFETSGNQQNNKENAA